MEKREEEIKIYATNLILSIIDESGVTTDRLIDRINSDAHIPQSMKAEVYTVSARYLNQLLINLAKQLPEGRNIKDVGSENLPEKIKS